MIALVGMTVVALVGMATIALVAMAVIALVGVATIPLVAMAVIALVGVATIALVALVALVAVAALVGVAMIPVAAALTGNPAQRHVVVFMMAPILRGIAVPGSRSRPSLALPAGLGMQAQVRVAFAVAANRKMLA